MGSSPPHPSSERSIALYRRTASAWDGARTDTGLEQSWLDHFMTLLAPSPSVLDLGCGTGRPIAVQLAARGAAITGVDAAPEMIAIFNSRVPGATAEVADMRGLDLGRRFDGILAWDSFFHLTPDDQAGMFAVFKRHAAPGAALMFTSGPEAGEAIGTWQGEDLYHASLAPKAYRRHLADHGFEVMDHRARDPMCGGHTVWLARFAG